MLNSTTILRYFKNKRKTLEKEVVSGIKPDLEIRVERLEKVIEDQELVMSLKSMYVFKPEISIPRLRDKLDLLIEHLGLKVEFIQTKPAHLVLKKQKKNRK